MLAMRLRPLPWFDASRAIFLWAVLLVSVCCMLESPASAAGELNEELMRRAPAIIEYLNEQNYRNIGVLKFRVQRGDEPLSDNVGELNTMIAQRLELALVLANPPRKDRQVGVIRDASAMAAMIAGANHLNSEGRVKLFTIAYPLAWGAERVMPDAMLTGLILVNDDLSKMSVGIFAFDSRGGALQKVIPPFEATAGGLTLGEMGESFLTRGAFDGGNLELSNGASVPLAVQPAREQDSIFKLASRVKSGEVPFPLLDPSIPVKLEVRYDDRPVPYEFRGGRAYLPEPLEHQEVRFVLTHSDLTDQTYGVVLKVNGENTLYRQRRSAVDCGKWIMYPHSPPTVVRGYQETQGEMRRFRVLSQAASKQTEMRYGKDTGQISFTVFREALPESSPPPNLLDEGAEDLLAMMRGAYPDQPAENLFALKSQLLAGGPTRGLIVENETTEEHRTQLVKFQPDPTPVLSATISYYTPQD